jgi:hypothetical protein
MSLMKPFNERAAEALDLLPEETGEPAVAYILEQAEKYRVLKMDIDAGRVSEWDFDDFSRRANLADYFSETE